MVVINSRKHRFVRRELPRILNKRRQIKKTNKARSKRKSDREIVHAKREDLDPDDLNTKSGQDLRDGGLGIGDDEDVCPLEDYSGEQDSETSTDLSSRVDEDEFKDLCIDERRRIVHEQIESHKVELLEIKEKDPEYYQFLLENDNAILEFAGKELTSEDKDIPSSTPPSASNIINWSKADLVIWKRMLLETKKLNTLKRVLVIFRTVVSSYTECKEGGQAWDATKLVEITSLCIKTAPVVFNHHLFKRDNVPPRDIFRAAQRPAWPRLKSLVRSYLTSIFSVMKFFTDNSMKCYVVAGLTPSVPYFHFSPSKQKKLISHLSYMWRSDEEKVAVRAFLLMKHMCLEFNKEVAELILSSMLHAYYEGSATGPSGVAFFNDTRTNFLTRSITEVCSCNVAVAYKKLFQSIRNLALTLRNCIAKNNASFRAELYHWKTIKKIVILTSVLSLSHTTSIDPDNARSDNRADVKLGSLVYPLVQVCLGIIRFNSSGEYTPLHLHIIQCLIDISRETGTFIPVSPYLFNILETPGMLSSGKPSTAKPVDFISLCKVPNDVMGTKQYNKLLTNKVFIMLLKYFSIYSTSISFPEMIVAPVSYAKNIIKQTLNAEAKKDLNILISKLEENAKFIVKKRSDVEFAPRDISKTISFSSNINISATPLSKYTRAIESLG